MNPKISITVDARNKAVAALTGMVTVGAKVDVEIRGITPDSVPEWAEGDEFTGKSLRFRVVDERGRDLVRFPLVGKSDGSDGDRWTVAEDGAFVTQSGTAGSPVVDFNTDRMRKAFFGVLFSDSLEFGVILDSIVDDAQYAVGRMKVRQWSACPADDPTVLPDWRETLRRLDEDLSMVEQSKADAREAADDAVVARNLAVAAKEASQSLANAALEYKNAAVASANAAGESATSAAGSASSAETSATQAAEQVAKYPYIDETTIHWMVWSATENEFVDTGVLAKGDKGDKGDAGDSPYVGSNGHWYVGNVDTGVTARGPKGDKGDTGETGATGAKIVSQEKTGTDPDGGNVYTQTFDDGTTATFTAPRGPQGAQGIQGIQGQKGDTGEKGEKGDPGADADVLGKLPVKPLPKYLHALSFDDPYPADAEAWYESLAPDAMGGACSAVRRGDKLWRNYDWTFDSSAEFVVRMSAASGRHASVGVASLGAALTEDEAASGVYTPKYRALPGMTLDGINDAGVVAEINVVGGDPEWRSGIPSASQIHPLAAVRWALDNGTSAEMVATNLAARIAFPEGWTQNFHYMVADATKTYIVENGVAHDVTDGTKVLTNYGVFDEAQAGGGKERYNLLAGGADISAVNWTKAYQNGNTWHSDFESEAQHAAAIEQWAAQGTDREAHRGKTTTSGKPWWQTVHTSVYDFATKTMKVAVQESGEYFTFAVDGANVELDDEVTEESENGVKSSGIWSWVKSLFVPNSGSPSWTWSNATSSQLFSYGDVDATIGALIGKFGGKLYKAEDSARTWDFIVNPYESGVTLQDDLDAMSQSINAKRDLKNNTCSESSFTNWVAHDPPSGVTFTRNQPGYSEDYGGWLWVDDDENIWYGGAGREAKSDVFSNGGGIVFFHATRERFATKDRTFVTEDVAARSFECGTGAAKQTVAVENGVAKLDDFFAESNSLLMGVVDGKIRYALATATSALADRTVNAVTLNDTNLTLTFPNPVSGKARDFLIRISKPTGATATLSITEPTLSTLYGDDWPSPEAGKNYLVAVTETAANEFYVRTLEITEVA